MKKLNIITFLILTAITSKAQVDSIYLHNKTSFTAKVISVTENTVSFIYPNEDAEQVYSRYAIRKIVYGKSHRVEKISAKIHVDGPADWSDVIVLDNHQEVAGLKRVDEIRGRTSFINYRTGAGADKAALNKLKKQAAELNCAFILITEDKDVIRKSGGIGHNQTIKRAIAYSY